MIFLDKDALLDLLLTHLKWWTELRNDKALTALRVVTPQNAQYDQPTEGEFVAARVTSCTPP